MEELSQFLTEMESIVRKYGNEADILWHGKPLKSLKR
jgi:hypothetical protein